MNLRPHWFLTMVPILAMGCDQPSVAPTATKVAAHPEGIKRLSTFGDKVECKLDCCAPPTRFALVAGQKTTPTKAEQTPAVQTEQAIGSTLVADFLKPAASPTPWLLEKQPRKILPPPAFLEHPESVFPPSAVELIQPPLEHIQVIFVPRPLLEDAPLSGQATDQNVPERQPLPAKPLVRLPRIDLEAPVELPPLARFQPDRAPLTDVTSEASLAAVLTKTIPVRVTPEPFVRFLLPDPFEFRDIRLSPPAEEK